jgi:hypothetical protein
MMARESGRLSSLKVVPFPANGAQIPNVCRESLRWVLLRTYAQTAASAWMPAQITPFDAQKVSIASIIPAAHPAASAGINAITAHWSDMANP